jgi:hypothetical protein
MVPGAVEHAIHPVAQHLRPQVPDDALADDREVVRVGEDPADRDRIADHPAQARNPSDRSGEPAQRQQHRESRPAGREQPQLVAAGTVEGHDWMVTTLATRFIGAPA